MQPTPDGRLTRIMVLLCQQDQNYLRSWGYVDRMQNHTSVQFIFNLTNIKKWSHRLVVPFLLTSCAYRLRYCSYRLFNIESIKTPHSVRCCMKDL